MNIYNNIVSDLPREKIETQGITSLSEHELLMVMLGSGIKNMPITKLANKIHQLLLDTAYTPTLEGLLEIPGLGKAKSLQILSSLEFALRLHRHQSVKIKTPQDLWSLVAQYGAQKQEYLLCITLNGAQELITYRVITIGLLNQTQIHPREVFADAITDRAASIVLAHNHPSGTLDPSPEDIRMTKRIKKVSEIVGIHLLDHLVFNQKNYLSFAEKGLL